jgi:hypothetical protein
MRSRPQAARTTSARANRARPPIHPGARNLVDAAPADAASTDAFTPAAAPAGAPPQPGWVATTTAQEDPRHRHGEFLDFLNLVARAYPRRQLHAKWTAGYSDSRGVT